jgi:hypothetical protein
VLLALRAPKRLACDTEALATILALRKEDARIWSGIRAGAALLAQDGLGMVQQVG